jgi:hypothetical protein
MSLMGSNGVQIHIPEVQNAIRPNGGNHPLIEVDEAHVGGSASPNGHLSTVARNQSRVRQAQMLTFSK